MVFHNFVIFAKSSNDIESSLLKKEKFYGDSFKSFYIFRPVKKSIIFQLHKMAKIAVKFCLES